MIGRSSRQSGACARTPKRSALAQALWRTGDKPQALALGRAALAALEAEERERPELKAAVQSWLTRPR